MLLDKGHIRTNNVSLTKFWELELSFPRPGGVSFAALCEFIDAQAQGAPEQRERTVFSESAWMGVAKLNNSLNYVDLRFCRPHTRGLCPCLHSLEFPLTGSLMRLPFVPPKGDQRCLGHLDVCQPQGHASHEQEKGKRTMRKGRTGLAHFFLFILAFSSENALLNLVRNLPIGSLIPWRKTGPRRTL